MVLLSSEFGGHTEMITNDTRSRFPGELNRQGSTGTTTGTTTGTICQWTVPKIPGELQERPRRFFPGRQSTFSGLVTKKKISIKELAAQIASSSNPYWKALIDEKVREMEDRENESSVVNDRNGTKKMKLKKRNEVRDWNKIIDSGDSKSVVLKGGVDRELKKLNKEKSKEDKNLKSQGSRRTSCQLTSFTKIHGESQERPRRFILKHQSSFSDKARIKELNLEHGARIVSQCYPYIKAIIDEKVNEGKDRENERSVVKDRNCTKKMKIRKRDEVRDGKEIADNEASKCLVMESGVSRELKKSKKEKSNEGENSISTTDDRRDLFKPLTPSEIGSKGKLKKEKKRGKLKKKIKRKVEVEMEARSA